MVKHLKSQIISRLNGVVSNYVHLPANSAPRARGVRNFEPVVCIKPANLLNLCHLREKIRKKRAHTNKASAFICSNFGTPLPLWAS